MAQLVEQLTVNQWVTGSSPVIPAICWCGSTVEQLTCNQQVVGSIPITSSNVEDFPSGQRGQTVNLLAVLSMVRIHLPPLEKLYIESVAGWSSSEARRAHNPKVAGSNPAPATQT